METPRLVSAVGLSGFSTTASPGIRPSCSPCVQAEKAFHEIELASPSPAQYVVLKDDLAHTKASIPAHTKAGFPRGKAAAVHPRHRSQAHLDCLQKAAGGRCRP
jgi:hypothetical protein